jgi:hypothetical protein
MQPKFELYNPSRSQATIVHEYTTQELICQGITRQISDFPEIYQPLLHKQILQFVDHRSPLAIRKSVVLTVALVLSLTIRVF